MLSGVCPPHGGNHTRTTYVAAQRFEGAKRRAAPRRIVRKRGQCSEEVRVRNQMGKGVWPASDATVRRAQGLCICHMAIFEGFAPPR